MATRVRTYRFEVRGELGDLVGRSFPTMRILHRRGNTVLVGPVRSQAELTELLEHCSALGLTLLGVDALDDGDSSSVRTARPSVRSRGSHSPG